MTVISIVSLNGDSEARQFANDLGRVMRVHLIPQTFERSLEELLERVLRDLLSVDQMLVVMDSSGAVGEMHSDGTVEPRFGDGWATIEQDTDPRGGGDPSADARRSLEFLRETGLSD